MLNSGQVRLRKGQLCPAELGKGLGQGPAGLELTVRARNRKKTLLQTIFNNPRSSIKPESAPDPKFYMYSMTNEQIIYLKLILSVCSSFMLLFICRICSLVLDILYHTTNQNVYLLRFKKQLDLTLNTSIFTFLVFSNQSLLPIIF